MYPAVAAAVVPVYNIKALRDQGLDLVLDRATLPAIFLGDIYEWTDPAILAIQPGGANGQIATILKNMADPTITPVVRNDGSGTTEIFTVALGLFEPTFTTRAGSSDVRRAARARPPRPARARCAVGPSVLNVLERHLLIPLPETPAAAARCSTGARTA